MDFGTMKRIEPGLRQLEAEAHHAGRCGSQQWLLFVHSLYPRIAKYAGRVSARHAKRVQVEKLHQAIRAALLRAWQRGASQAKRYPPVGGSCRPVPTGGFPPPVPCNYTHTDCDNAT